ncbi:MAG: hypothetical protein ACYS1A_16150 [Planctomycetota bacterium]|jgi:hypothetical protein
MEKRSLIFWMLIAVVMFSGMVNTAAGKEKTQQERTEEIGKYISRLRREIGNFYAATFTELRLRADEEIRALEVADKGVFASLAEQTEAAEKVLLINGYSSGRCCRFGDRGHRFRNTTARDPERFAVVQSQIAEKKSDILSRYESQRVELERGKRYALTAGLTELEKRLKEDVLAVKPELASGVVTGIVHSKEKPSAIIDGRIVYERDTIHRVRIVKIHRNKVDFVKGGQKWSQKVQETPAAFWR